MKLPAGKRIVIRALTATGQYSGGRLHAWVLAEGLAEAGGEVLFWGEAVPDFVRDFSGYPRHATIRWHAGPGAPGWTQCDLVIVVPHTGLPRAFYPEVLLFAQRTGGRIVLLNFETPNWFNALSPQKRDPALWDDWRKIARAADVILSSSEEGNRYAQTFYTDARLGCAFLRLHPAINSLVADAVAATREDQILCITRFSNKHKGSEDLAAIIGPAIAGYTLTLIVGAGGVSEQTAADLRSACARHNVRLRVLCAVSDREKFVEIKKSRLLLFPSYFEGFGYPPVEALYCGTPCVAYALPVLKEVSGTQLFTVPAGDHPALGAMISRALSEPVDATVLRQQVAPWIEFFAFSRLAAETLSPCLSRPPVSHGITTVLRWTFDHQWLKLVDGMRRGTTRLLAGIKRRMNKRPATQRA